MTPGLEAFVGAVIWTAWVGLLYLPASKRFTWLNFSFSAIFVRWLRNEGQLLCRKEMGFTGLYWTTDVFSTKDSFAVDCWIQAKNKSMH